MRVADEVMQAVLADMKETAKKIGKPSPKIVKMLKAWRRRFQQRPR